MKLVQRMAIGWIRLKIKFLIRTSPRLAAAFAFRLFCTPPARTLGIINQESTPPIDLSANFQGLAITGYCWNRGGGRKLLIIHGFQSTALNFQHFVAPLVAKGYEVYAFDAPGHGRSGGRRINVKLYKEFILELQRKYGPFQAFLAHSLGGLALGLALTELSVGDDTRVVLVAPVTETSTAIDHFFRLLKINDARVRKEFERIIMEIGGHPPAWFSMRRIVPLISAKILWVHDRDDDITPWADAEKVKELNHPNIDFMITDGLGHRKVYKDREVGKTIVDYL